MQTKDGFTIIEVLVAITILLFLTVAVTSPLAGLFGVTKNNTELLGASSKAQQTLEYVRSEWLIQSKYDASCVNNTLTIASYGVVSVKALDYAGIEQTNPIIFNTTCIGATASSTIIPIKRITVVSNENNAQSTLSVDIARPQ